MRKFAIVVLLALAVPAAAQEMVKALSEDGLEKTISYDVSKFTDIRDKKLEDVLRKMPGMQVMEWEGWVANGGVLITSQRASQWAIENGIATHFNTVQDKKGEAEKPGEKSEKEAYKRLDYSAQREQNGPSRIGGVLYAADLDITNPLAYGIHNRQLYTMKTGNYILPRPKSPYASLLQLKGDKQIGGYLTKQNQKLLKDATVIAFDNVGAGTVVLFSESPTYRGYWLSTGRILANALFFGNNVSGSSRYRP